MVRNIIKTTAVTLGLISISVFALAANRGAARNVPVVSGSGAGVMSGSSWLQSTSGSDVVTAGAGNDMIRGGAGDDVISGSSSKVRNRPGYDYETSSSSWLYSTSGSDAVGLDSLEPRTRAAGDDMDTAGGSGNDVVTSNYATLGASGSDVGNDRVTNSRIKSEAGKDIAWVDAAADGMTHSGAGSYVRTSNVGGSKPVGSKGTSSVTKSSTSRVEFPY